MAKFQIVWSHSAKGDAYFNVEAEDAEQAVEQFEEWCLFDDYVIWSVREIKHFEIRGHKEAAE